MRLNVTLPPPTVAVNVTNDVEPPISVVEVSSNDTFELSKITLVVPNLA